MNRTLIPLIVFLVIVGFLWKGLSLNPRDVPSVLIEKAAPEIVLPDLFDPSKQVRSTDLKGEVWLLNVWGTWCPECWREHGFLMELAQRHGVKIMGIDWRDDAEDAKQMLAKEGNPFIAVGFDPESSAIMDWGVYGAPETFLIDQEGVIRWKHAGGLSAQLWEQELRPLMIGLGWKP